MKSGSRDLDSATKRKGPIPQSPRADPKTVCCLRNVEVEHDVLLDREDG